MAFEHVNSVLLADIGSVHTRLALIDIVEGQYRFVAGARTRTTAEAPLGSVNIGLDRAAQAITAATGRRLIGPGAESLFLMPESDGHGSTVPGDRRSAPGGPCACCWSASRRK